MMMNSFIDNLPSTGAREEPQCLTPQHHSCNPTSRTWHFDDDDEEEEDIYIVMMLMIIIRMIILLKSLVDTSPH